MSTRHEKWVRVEPGTVIPAGQPYRVEHHQGSPVAQEFIWFTTETTLDLPERDYFVDSSWKPPLALPTTPTWGILIYRERNHWISKFRVEGERVVGRGGGYTDVSNVHDFIPLTDEQVARIEAAR